MRKESGIRKQYSLFLFMLMLGTSLIAQDKPFYVDFHHVGALKHFYSREIKGLSPWEEIQHDCEGNYSEKHIKIFAEYPKVTQAHFRLLAEGNVRLSSLSILPIEVRRLKTRFFDTDGLMDQGQQTLSCLTGISATKDFVLKDERDYFNSDVIEYLEFIEKYADKRYHIGADSVRYKIIKDPLEIFTLQNQPGTIGIVLSLEGGHALGNSLYIDKGLTDSPEYEKLLLDNVAKIKGRKSLVEGFEKKLDYPVLYIGLSHLFWNGISGQAHTLHPTQEAMYKKIKGFEASITPIGEKVIEKLLSKSDGYRILIDIRQMNIPSRAWYYNYVSEKRQEGDTIPIVSSHSAVSGISWDNPYYLVGDKGKFRDDDLNHRPVSLSREDIQAIYESKGLIGLSLSKYELCGGNILAMLKGSQPGSRQERELAVRAILANIFTIVQTIGRKDAWDIISIGSDFDALQIPFTPYQNSASFPDLAKDIEEFLSDPGPIFSLFSETQVRTYMFDYTPKALTQKIMGLNALYFTAEHLGKGQSTFPD